MEVPVFNQARAKFCPYHGGGIEKHRRKGQIYRKGLRQSISRRDWAHRTLTQVRLSPANTRLSEVSKETVIRYLKELSDKYALGSVIADVPSNKTGLNKDIFELNGDNALRGQMILEVPEQHEAVSKKLIDYANLKGIKIRDTNNHIYNK